MANQIILKRSSTPGKVPTTSQLALGEIGINTYDGLIYIKKDDGTPAVVQIGGVTSVNTKTGAAVLTTSDIAEGTAQYFTNARARSALNGGSGITYSSTTGAIAVDTATIATKTYVDGKVSDLVASAPDTLNTLNELAAALNSDASFSTTVTTSIATKLAKSANLSDLSNVATARTNLGLATVAATGSYTDLSNKLTNADYRAAFSGSAGVSYNSSTGAFTVDTTVATLTGTQTLTNKTLTSPTINSATINGATIGGSLIPATDVTYDLGDDTHRFRDLYLSGSTIKLGTATLSASGTGLALGGSAVVTIGDTGTVTNTMLAGSIANAKLTNSAVTVTAGTGLSGGGSVSLGGTITLTNTITQYTDALATTAARAAHSAGAGISYNSTTGAITSTITQYTDAMAKAAITAGTGITVTGGVVASTITQYTDALARGAVSFVAGSGAYNSTTGVITIPTNTSQLTNGANFATTSYVDTAVAGKDNTDEITEGTTNLFFTTARSRGSISASGSLSYNSTTGVISYTTPSTTGIAEGTNLYYTDARAIAANTSAIATAKSEAIASAASDATTKANAAQAAAIAAVTNGAGAAFDTLLEIQNAMATDTELAAAIAAISNVPSATKLQTARTINGASFDGTANVSFSTTAVSEGTNLYYTDARARAAHSFTAGSGAYNSTTGAITIPTNTNQLTNGAGFITGYTETSTLANVTARGATTTAALSTGALTVTGGITASGEITAYFSDERLKQDIAPIQGALDKVMAIGGYTYKANDLAHELGVSRYDNQIGLLAGEVEAVMPELVTQSALAGYKTIRYDKVVSVLVEAIKEQQAMIEELRKDVKKTLR